MNAQLNESQTASVVDPQGFFQRRLLLPLKCFGDDAKIPDC